MLKKIKHIYHVILSDIFPHKYYDKDGTPKKCPFCGGKDIQFIATDYINHTISEGYERCNCCRKGIIDWAYGSYNPYQLPTKMRK
ncbi:hypothetical protein SARAHDANIELLE_36 [Hafnia phage vB_HpaM_SarahDanielle]|uniref:Uncharacterized protein n=1 Tax=Hafnia phage vB_HpaM_SarahDanielle TaxID=2836113 RepID=A0AAE7WCJ3_9CAUD|nr:hypothetical protein SARAHDANIELLE_36 [Hafnia phage vB_HpaM_SarahDanielle]